MHCAVVTGHADEGRVLVEINAAKDRADGNNENQFTAHLYYKRPEHTFYENKQCREFHAAE